MKAMACRGSLGDLRWSHHLNGSGNMEDMAYGGEFDGAWNNQV